MVLAENSVPYGMPWRHHALSAHAAYRSRARRRSWHLPGSGVHLADVGAVWAATLEGIIDMVERVGEHWVGAERGVVGEGAQRERRAARPTSHRPCGEERTVHLHLVGLARDERLERLHVLLELAEDHVRAVAGPLEPPGAGSAPPGRRRRSADVDLRLTGIGDGETPGRRLRDAVAPSEVLVAAVMVGPHVADRAVGPRFGQHPAQLVPEGHPILVDSLAGGAGEVEDAVDLVAREGGVHETGSARVGPRGLPQVLATSTALLVKAGGMPATPFGSSLRRPWIVKATFRPHISISGRTAPGAMPPAAIAAMLSTLVAPWPNARGCSATMRPSWRITTRSA